jgi:hypothetical protein
MWIVLSPPPRTRSCGWAPRAPVTVLAAAGLRAVVGAGGSKHPSPAQAVGGAHARSDHQQVFIRRPRVAG